MIGWWRRARVGRRLGAVAVLVGLLGAGRYAAAQDTTRAGTPGRSSPPDTLVVLRVQVLHQARPVPAATVQSGRISGLTDDQGRTTLRLPAGERRLVAARIGFRPDTLVVVLRAGADTSLVMRLLSPATELASVVVSATRTERRIEDEPLRVEMLTQEEVEEKLRMTPGDITMMLNESAGLRVQATSPSLGGANVRVQGLRGRYTQMLADGLPLYGGQAGNLGLLQIPPMDLAGVEVIKGVASALYGGAALGGVINLISRRPDDARIRELLVNQTTLGGTDAVGFASDRLGSQWGYTLLAGLHRQSRVDRDDDRWADLPGYGRGLVRPRVFWTHPEGHSAMFTAGTTLESRSGGTMNGGTAPNGEPYAERLRTARYDAGGVGRFQLGRASVLSVRGSLAMQRHRHTFGDTRENDRHRTWFGETALTVARGRAHWVLGAALQEERYRSAQVPAFDFTFTTPGLFAQSTIDISPRVAVTASARVDQHSEYGTQWAPRVSALLRLAPGWSIRTSAGTGYFAPTPFTEETEVIGLTPLVEFQGLRVERAQSGSVDLGGLLGSVEVHATVFGSEIEHPVNIRPAVGQPGRVELINVEGPTRTVGGELLARWQPEPFHVTASYTYLRSTELDPESGARRDVPLTPRHQAGVVGMWEDEERARVGIEVYYTGRQALEDNPYRRVSRSYVHIGVLVERRFGRAGVFVNAENLLDYRQTEYDPLVLPSRGLGGRWTTDVWGPLEGRVANVGVRVGW